MEANGNATSTSPESTVNRIGQNKTLESRAYQIEMFQQSMRENIIVAMDTGSGKTQIAKLRIEAELERSPQQRVWFCAPSVVLAQQQHLFLATQLPAYQARLITGLDNVQYWSTQAVWDAALENIDIVVSTPQVLLDALSHAFVSLLDLSLLVFDEAHHCMANNPMALIMQRFYLPKRTDVGLSHLPHVLGLTASPITNKVSMLDELEKNMSAVCTTPTIQVEDYQRHVYLPELDRIAFSPATEKLLGISKALKNLVEGLSVVEDPTVRWLQSTKSTSVLAQQKLNKILESGRTPVMKQMRSFFGHTEHIQENIGSWAADLYVRTCAARLHEAVVRHEPLVPNLADQEQRYIDQKLQFMLSAVPPVHDQALGDHLVAPKTQALIKYLRKEYQPGITVIVFVKRRPAAFAITALLQAHSLMSDYAIFSFVGTANPVKRSLVDLADMQLQNEAFVDFQAGKRNICVATQVMEEGIDVQATNLVIRFDEPENFRSFVQSRGRARRPDSKFVMVHATDATETTRKIGKWKELENVMKEQYSGLTRSLSAQAAVEQQYEEGNEFYRVAETGALLSYDNATQHLEHFCATLEWGDETEPPRPIAIVSGAPFSPKSAQVVLPSAVPRPFQVTNSLRTWRTEKMAKKDAAFQAYKRLHTAKLVNDNLLPWPRMRKGFDKLETRDSKYEVKSALDPWIYFRNSHAEHTDLHWHCVKISGHDFAPPDMMLQLPIQLDCDLCFKLHSSLMGSVLVTIVPEFHGSTVPQDIAQRITRHLFMAILGRRLKRVNLEDQLPYSLLPAIAVSDPSAWLEKVQYSTPLADLTFNDTLGQRPYLLKYGKEEILYRWSPSFNDTNVRRYSQDEKITAERLSKQLSFFNDNPPAEEASTSDTRCLNVFDCSVQGLPEAYSTTMLLMPSISYMLTIALRGQVAKDSLLAPIAFSNSKMLMQALTSSSALHDHNYESLEFVGDSLLKYYASVQVFFEYPDLTDGGLTNKYGKIVNNARLQRATKDLGLDAYITVEPFSGPKWTLAVAENDQPHRQMSSKTLADVIEALLGATYLDPSNGPTKDELPLSALTHVFPDIDWKSPKSHIQDYYQVSGPSKAHIARLEDIEGVLDYEFKHKSLLVEALTRTSVRIGIQSFERLEFLGDAILDRIVNVALYASGIQLEPESLKYRRDALVNRWLLAFLAMEAHHVVITNQIETSPSGDTKLTPTPKTIRLIDHMRVVSEKAEQLHRQKAETTFLQVRDQILTALDTGNTFPWIALHSIHTPKSYSDVIESITAAVFIDSGGSLAACEKVLDSLGLLKLLRRLSSEPNLDVRSPIVQLVVEHPSVVLNEKSSGKVSAGCRTWSCSISLGEEAIASFESTISRKHAEACAAQSALDTLGARTVDENVMDVD